MGTHERQSGTAAECRTAETLFLYSEGLLEPDESRAVAVHVRACPQCAVRLREELSLSTTLRSLPAPRPSKNLAAAVTRHIRASRARAVSRWWWALATVLLLASGLQWLVTAGFSPSVALRNLTVALVDLVRSPLILAGDLADGSLWRDLAAFLDVLARVATSSPWWLAATAASFMLVAAATNSILYLAVRHALAGQRSKRSPR